MAVLPARLLRDGAGAVARGTDLARREALQARRGLHNVKLPLVRLLQLLQRIKHHAVRESRFLLFTCGEI